MKKPIKFVVTDEMVEAAELEFAAGRDMRAAMEAAIEVSAVYDLIDALLRLNIESETVQREYIYDALDKAGGINTYNSFSGE